MDRQAWRDFFITVFLLGIAFVIALLSSIAAQQNMTRLAAVAAAISLLLAVIGAIYIVPRLARKVQLEFLRFAVRTTVTVEGLFFVVLLVVIAFAAWNTANNLLYLILSAMLAFLFTANLISRLSLADLSIQLRFPDHIFADETASLSVTVTNHKRIIPTFSLIVEPLSEAGVEQSRRSAESKANGQAAVGRLPDGDPEQVKRDTSSGGRRRQNGARAEDGSRDTGRYAETGIRARRQNQTLEPLGKLAHFILVPPGTSLRQRIEHKFERRGCYPITAFRISTRFPTGFFKKWRKIEAAGEIIIYPKPKPLDDFYHALPMLAGQVSSHLRGTGDDLYGLRRYHPSDHIRFIDWKATAKSKELIVRDHMREDERRLTIVFDTSQPPQTQDPNRPRDPGSASEPTRSECRQLFANRFEEAIVMAASLAKHFIQEGAEVELLTLREDEWVESGKGLDHLHRIFRALATLEPDSEADSSKQTSSREDLQARAESIDANKAPAARKEWPGAGRVPTAAGDETQSVRSLWHMMEQLPLLADERRFKVFITSAAKGTIPASIWRSAHVVFMEDLDPSGRKGAAYEL
jgi:uncharacterized protein (DUF58 family)